MFRTKNVRLDFIIPRFMHCIALPIHINCRQFLCLKKKYYMLNSNYLNYNFFVHLFIFFTFINVPFRHRRGGLFEKPVAEILTRTATFSPIMPAPFLPPPPHPFQTVPE